MSEKWCLVIMILALAAVAAVVADVSIEAYKERQEIIAEEERQEQILKESEENFKLGMEKYGAEEYEKARDYFRKVLDGTPMFEEAQKMIDKAEEKISEIKKQEAKEYIAKAEESIEEDDLSAARRYIRRALSRDRDLEVKHLYEMIETREEELEEQRKQEEVLAFKEECREYEYRVLDKDAMKLSGEKIKFRGQVMQIYEPLPGVTVMRVGITPPKYGSLWDDDVYITYPESIEVYERDMVKVWGTIEGFHTYETVAGWTRTIPQVDAKYVEYD